MTLEETIKCVPVESGYADNIIKFWKEGIISNVSSEINTAYAIPSFPKEYKYILLDKDGKVINDFYSLYACNHHPYDKREVEFIFGDRINYFKTRKIDDYTSIFRGCVVFKDPYTLYIIFVLNNNYDYKTSRYYQYIKSIDFTGVDGVDIINKYAFGVTFKGEKKMDQIVYRSPFSGAEFMVNNVGSYSYRMFYPSPYKQYQEKKNKKGESISVFNTETFIGNVFTIVNGDNKYGCKFVYDFGKNTELYELLPLTKDYYRDWGNDNRFNVFIIWSDDSHTNIKSVKRHSKKITSMEKYTIDNYLSVIMNNNEYYCIHNSDVEKYNKDEEYARFLPLRKNYCPDNNAVVALYDMNTGKIMVPPDEEDEDIEMFEGKKYK